MKSIVTILLLLLVFAPYSAQAENKAVEIEIKGDTAKVTLLEGKAELIKKGMIKAQPLMLGDYIAHGDRISTKKGSRIELKLPDNSLIRFDEFTTFEIVCVEFDKKAKQRNINISMVLGKTWANVSKIFGQRGHFAVSTKTAVAGVRGTIYRVNVEEDNSVLVKVYWGEVGVSSAPRKEAAEGPAPVMKPAAR